MWSLENETSTTFEARLFSFMDSAFAFVDLCTQVGEASFQVLLVVPTIGEGPHILLDSLRILPGNFVFAMDREGYEALQVAPDLVQQLCSIDAYLLFDLGFSSELHLVVCHIAEAKAMPFALGFPIFCTIPIYSARTFQLPKKSGFRTSRRDSVAGHDPGCNKMWSSWHRSKRPPSPRSTQPAQRKCVRK